MKLYDEKEAVAFIRQRVANADEAVILDVIDAIYDYYDETDSLEIDFDEDDNSDDTDDVAAICAYAVDAVKNADPALIESIIRAELDYQQSLL